MQLTGPVFSFAKCSSTLLRMTVRLVAFNFFQRELKNHKFSFLQCAVPLINCQGGGGEEEGGPGLRAGGRGGAHARLPQTTEQSHSRRQEQVNDP